MIPLKVLHVTGAYPTPDNPKKHVFVKDQVESLARIGVQVDVCVLEGNGPLKYIFGIGQLRKHLRGARYDLIHAHYMYAGWTARFSSALPLVVTFLGSDVYGNCNHDGSSKKISRVGHILFSKLLSSFASASIVPSSRMAVLVGSNSAVIPHGVDFDIFKEEKPNRLTLSLDARKFYILFAGVRSNPVKRFPLAEQAVNIVKKEHPNVKMIEIDGLSRNEVARFMNAVDCLLVTSAHEAGPIVVKEALACNLPVVSVDVGDVPERLLRVDNCWVVNPSAEEIATALEQVLKSGRRSSNGRIRIESVSLEASAQKISEVYESVLRKSAA